MKTLIQRLLGKIPVIGFNAGDHVLLIDDPRQRVYVVEELDVDEHGIPNVSRGPIGQLPPSISYLVRDKNSGDLHYFRADSIMHKSMSPVAKKIAKIEQQIKEAQEMVYDHEHKAKEQQEKIEILKRELNAWTREHHDFSKS